MTDGTRTPTVSVIVAAYNDAKRLPTALRSLTNQTMADIEIIVIDDCSTDGTADVVARAALADPRIHYVCLPVNSGSCAVPRNRGIEEARAPWVMFCDSDDEFERHAVKNLLLAAERADADLACGVAERVDITTGMRVRSREDRHSPRVLESIDADPDLIYDWLAANKLYRRRMLVDHGIRFAKASAQPDRQFTIEAYVCATRIAVIAETVYSWSVDRIGEELTVAQRRREVRTVDGRVEGHRLADEFLAGHGSEGVRRAKTQEFLANDLVLYLSVILEADDESAQAIVDALRPYVATIDLSIADELRPMHKVAIYHLLVDDLEGIRRAMRFLCWASAVDGTVQVRAGREYWVCAHDGSGKQVGGHSVDWWLDVTRQGLAVIPLTRRRLCHVLRDGESLRGTTANYLDVLEQADSARLIAVLDDGTVVAQAPVVFEQVTPLQWEWAVEGALQPVGTGYLGRRGLLMIELTVGGKVNRSHVRSRSVRTGTTLPLRYGIARTEGLHLEHRDLGAVGWRLIRRSPVRMTTGALRRGWKRMPGAAALTRRYERLMHVLLPGLAGRIASRLPSGNAVLLSSDHGRRFDGHPAAISQGLLELAPTVRQYWLGERPPAHAVRVDPHTIRGSWRIKRARAWVDDMGMALSKPARTRYLQAWHGIALKHVGSDVPDYDLMNEQARRTRTIDAWDALISPSEFFADTTARAIGYRGELVPGSPLGEAILARAAQADLRERLDLPTDRLIVLYSPTQRALHAREGTDPVIDLERWWRELGRDAYLLVRSHPQDRLRVPNRYENAVRDVSDEPDWASWIAAADVLVTDYAAVVFDFARLGRPMAYFAPDHDEYVSRANGLYLEIERSGPGPLLRTQEQLHSWVLDRIAGAPAQDYGDFADTYAGRLDGASVQRAVDWLLS